MERLRPEQKLLEEDLRSDGNYSIAAGDIQRTFDPPQHSESHRRIHEMGHQQRLPRRSGNAVSRIRQVQSENRVQPELAAEGLSIGLRHHESAAVS